MIMIVTDPSRSSSDKADGRPSCQKGEVGLSDIISVSGAVKQLIGNARWRQTSAMIEYVALSPLLGNFVSKYASAHLLFEFLEVVHCTTQPNTQSEHTASATTSHKMNSERQNKGALNAAANNESNNSVGRTGRKRETRGSRLSERKKAKGQKRIDVQLQANEDLEKEVREEGGRREGGREGSWVESRERAA